MNNRIIKNVLAILVVVVLIALGVMAVKKAKKREQEAPVAKSYGVVVSTFKPAKKPVQLTLPYLAESKNDRDVNLSSKVAARVTMVRPGGTHVKKGDIVARLDNASIQSNVNSVNAQKEALKVALRNLESSHERTLELVKVNGASIEQSQQEESKISELKSKMEALNQKILELDNLGSYTVVRSPVNGNISKTMVHVGDMAMPGHPIANIQANNGFYLVVRAPKELTVKGIDYDGKQLDAIPLNSSFNGLAEYKVYVDDPELTSGNRVEVNVLVYDGEGVLLPFDTVINRNGKSFVLVRKDDHATPQEVNIIESGEQGAVVSNEDLVGKEIILAKQDILLKLLAGVSLKIKGE